MRHINSAMTVASSMASASGSGRAWGAICTRETASKRPPPTAGILQENAELRSTRARQHIDERQPFNKTLFGDPLPLVLELGLHDAHDGGTTVGGHTQFQETSSNVLPVSCKMRVFQGRRISLLIPYAPLSQACRGRPSYPPACTPRVDKTHP